MIPKTKEEMNQIRTECRLMVNRRATASAAVALIPIPGLDMTTDIAIMLEVLPAINRRFGLSPEDVELLDSEIKAKIFVISTSIGSQLVGKVITKELIEKMLKKIGVRVAAKQIAKYIPFIGQIAGAGISFTAIKYLGYLHIDECYKVCERVLSAEKSSF